MEKFENQCMFMFYLSLMFLMMWLVSEIEENVKNIILEVRTWKVNDTVCVVVEPVCQTISHYLPQNVKFRATKFTYCSCLSRQPNSMMSTSSSVYSISISMSNKQHPFFKGSEVLESESSMLVKNWKRRKFCTVHYSEGMVRRILIFHQHWTLRFKYFQTL